MFLKAQNEQPERDTNDMFQFTSSYIRDELDLIQAQQENIVSLAQQMDLALKQTGHMAEMLKIMKKVDDITLRGISDKRRKESTTLNLIEEVKSLIAKQKYEELDRLMRGIHKGSQEKIHLSQEELHRLRELGNQMKTFYEQAVGFVRISQALYQRVAKTYEDCEAELSKELQEEEALSRAGSYAGSGEGKLLNSSGFQAVLGNGVSKWVTKY